MFQLDTTSPKIIYRRPTGRLSRPSDFVIHGHGLGELDGITDIFKNFGFGLVRQFTGGLYDPSKNRFYVPFSGGQVRNWAHGVANVHTLGLVNTDKFFNSQPVRTIAQVGAGVLGAVVGKAAWSTYGPGGTSSMFGKTPPSTTTPTTSVPVTTTSSVTKAVTSVPTPSPTQSLFSTIVSGAEKVGKVLDVGTKIFGAVASGASGGQMQQDQPSMVVMQGDPNNPVLLPPNTVYPNATGGMYPPNLMAMNPGMVMGPGGVPVMGPGGGGGFGPPGSEFAPMQEGAIPGVDDGSMGMGTKLTLAVAGGAAIYYIFLRK